MITARGQDNPDWLEDFLRMIDQARALYQQAADKGRYPDSLSEIHIEPYVDPRTGKVDHLDVLLKALQAESGRNREVSRLNTNALSAVVGGLFRLNANLGRIIRKQHEIEKRLEQPKRK